MSGLKCDNRTFVEFLMDNGWSRLAAVSMEWCINGKASYEDEEAYVKAFVHEDCQEGSS